jgi:hypothetical protein
VREETTKQEISRELSDIDKVKAYLIFELDKRLYPMKNNGEKAKLLGITAGMLGELKRGKNLDSVSLDRIVEWCEANGAKVYIQADAIDQSALRERAAVTRDFRVFDLRMRSLFESSRKLFLAFGRAMVAKAPHIRQNAPHTLSHCVRMLREMLAMCEIQAKINGIDLTKQGGEDV